jgi:leucine dehydrogenase
MVFTAPSFDDHQRVSYWRDAEAGITAIVAQHRIFNGRAVGGCRVRAYGDEDQALDDVLRLSRGMTYKTALADLPYGGAKAVVIGDPRKVKTTDALRSIGRFVDSLGGTYVTAEDVGMVQADLKQIATATRWVVGADESVGPGAPFTARGVFEALRAAVAHRRGTDDLSDVSVAVQGAGSVGRLLCGLLAERGCRLTVADIDSDTARRVAGEFDAKVGDPGTIHTEAVDIFCPCALGGILNERTIPEIAAGMVVGAANNQLEREADGELLHRRRILYVADFIASAGGVIHGVDELDGYDPERVERRISGIHRTALRVLERAQEASIAASSAARQEAEERMRSRAVTATLGAPAAGP